MEKLGVGINKLREKIEQEKLCRIDKSQTIESQALMFYDKLCQIIRPKNQSDRTGFRRISNWILRGINTERLPNDTFELALLYAEEAAGPDSRNPAAVFMKIIKTEIGYGKY